MSCNFSGLTFCGSPGPGTGQSYDYAVMAPFVKITVAGGDGSTITVGNKSCPNYSNSAIITEFSAAYGQGINVDFKVVDQHGGPFFNFYETLLKCAQSKTSYATADYGWVWTNCDGSTGKIALSDRSQKISFNIMSAKVNKANGAYHYAITGTDVGVPANNSVSSEIEGDDAQNKMSLKDAIKKLCREHNPQIQVSFRSIGVDSDDAWDFLADNDKPKAAWKANNLPPIKAIYEWIRGYKTQNSKGIFITGDDISTPPNKIILWEHTPNACDLPSLDDMCSRNVGNFVVHGGNCSPVIDFNPTMDWNNIKANITQGGSAGSPVSAETEQNLGETPSNQNEGGACNADYFKKQGIVGAILIDDTHIMNYGKESVTKIKECQNSNQGT